MDTRDLKIFIEKIKYLSDRKYLFALISYHIAPTIKGSKPASIITLNRNERRLNELWKQYKKYFSEEFNLQYYELKVNEECVIVMFYDEKKLKEQIFNKMNMSLLRKYQYNEDMSLEEALKFLSKRMENACPHEMGIFLGFPLEDVEAFIVSPNKAVKLCGYWKVYNNVEYASEIFKQYDDAKVEIINSILKDCKI